MVTRDVCFRAEAKFASMAEMRRRADIGKLDGPAMISWVSIRNDPLYDLKHLFVVLDVGENLLAVLVVRLVA